MQYARPDVVSPDSWRETRRGQQTYGAPRSLARSCPERMSGNHRADRYVKRLTAGAFLLEVAEADFGLGSARCRPSAHSFAVRLRPDRSGRRGGFGSSDHSLDDLPVGVLADHFAVSEAIKVATCYLQALSIAGGPDQSPSRYTGLPVKASTKCSSSR